MISQEKTDKNIIETGSEFLHHLLNLIHHQQPNIDKKQLLNCEEVDLKHFKDPKPFMEYSNDMNDAYDIIKE